MKKNEMLLSVTLVTIISYTIVFKLLSKMNTNQITTIEMKTCSKCETDKPLTDFANNKCSTATHDSDGNRLIRPECKDCTKREASDRKKAYVQAGKPGYPPAGTGCEICAKPGTSRFPILRFDHNHETLAHRGWLCDKCNRSLGCLGDDVASIVKVLNYLNKSEKKTLAINEDGEIKIV